MSGSTLRGAVGRPLLALPPPGAWPRCVAALAMHHIYSDEKKAGMLALVAQHGLTGRYLYGKPGRVVVEGTPEGVEAFERGTRRMRWSKCKVMGRVWIVDDAEARDTDVGDDAAYPCGAPYPHYTIYASGLRPMPRPGSAPVPVARLVEAAEDPDTDPATVWHPEHGVFPTYDQAPSADDLAAELRAVGLDRVQLLLERPFSSGSTA